MTTSDWTYITRLARQKGVSLHETGVKRSMTCGYAIDCVLAASGQHPILNPCAESALAAAKARHPHARARSQSL